VRIDRIGASAHSATGRLVYDARVKEWPTRTLAFEERESLRIVVIVRWAILAGLLVLVDYPLRSDPRGFFVTGGLWSAAVGLNLVLEWLLRTQRPVAIWLPLAVGAFDAAAITGEIALIDGFDNASFVLYYPALMAFAAFFPGRVGLTYVAGIIATYALLSVSVYERFDRSTATDWHDLGLRLITMAAAALMAYLLVRVERGRRLRAVQAEAARQQEIQALESRAFALERAAQEERRRLVRDIHDGVSQGVYMLGLGLESAAHEATAARGQPTELLQALVRLSKQTLLDARGLLFDLSTVIDGSQPLDEMLQHQAAEFRAVTGLNANVVVTGDLAPMPAATVAEVYRVVQESLANVYRHAGASCVFIELHAGRECTTLRVRDDGVGLRPPQGTPPGHGLRSMAERAARIGAHFDASEPAGGGTTVTLTIPAHGGSNGDSCPARG
jgi:signal transduction histidine kinase